MITDESRNKVLQAIGGNTELEGLFCILFHGTGVQTIAMHVDICEVLKETLVVMARQYDGDAKEMITAAVEAIKQVAARECKANVEFLTMRRPSGNLGDF